MSAGRHHLRANGQGVGESRTGSAEIEAPAVGRPDLVLQDAGSTGKNGVRGRRPDDDEADFCGGDAGLPDRADRSFLRHVRRRHAVVDDVALADAGALENPFV
jgi:hypothetical protein